MLSPVEVESFREHHRLQVFIFFFLPESLLLQQGHQRISLLDYLQHLIQNLFLLCKFLLALQMVCREWNIDFKRMRITLCCYNMIKPILEYKVPSTAMRSRSSCCSRLCLSSNSSSRALQRGGREENKWLLKYCVCVTYFRKSLMFKDIGFLDASHGHQGTICH